MELRRPRLADKETVLEMMAEFEKSQSAHDGGFWDTEGFSYENWLETNLNKEMGINLPENRVPSIQFVLFDESGHALGFLNLRLRLNEGLLNYAGNIGYSIRPSERGKGYSKEALRQGLQVAKEKNIHRALVTCSTENPASRAVILANGGELEDVRNGTERYWIDVDQGGNMELRRPTLEDKEAILEMIAEFDAAKSYMHGGMGSAWKRAKDYEDCLKIVEQQEDAANLPVGWVPAIKFLSFDETGFPL